ncbi:MAG: hypothetical protein K0R15_2650 [Clostridiales bacterium]|jgi:hypothetical protein|nr:hypothetical protein [Clostridiales bacterium]
MLLRTKTNQNMKLLLMYMMHDAAVDATVTGGTVWASAAAGSAIGHLFLFQ